MPVLAAEDKRENSIIKTFNITSLLCAVSIAALATPAQAQTVLTTHRLSAAMASEAVAAAVASCATKGYKVTASIIDTDGVVQAMLRGDGASMTMPGAARNKAYTAIMLGASRGDSGVAVAKRMGGNTSAGGLAKLPHILLLPGALVIRSGGEAIAAIGVGGARAAISTRPAPRPGSTRSPTG